MGKNTHPANIYISRVSDGFLSGNHHLIVVERFVCPSDPEMGSPFQLTIWLWANNTLQRTFLLRCYDTNQK